MLDSRDGGSPTPELTVSGPDPYKQHLSETDLTQEVLRDLETTNARLLATILGPRETACMAAIRNLDAGIVPEDQMLDVIRSIADELEPSELLNDAHAIEAIVSQVLFLDAISTAFLPDDAITEVEAPSPKKEGLNAVPEILRSRLASGEMTTPELFRCLLTRDDFDPDWISIQNDLMKHVASTGGEPNWILVKDAKSSYADRKASENVDVVETSGLAF